jgi:hypothetical protein
MKLVRLVQQDYNRYYDEDGNAYLLFSLKEVLATERMLAIRYFMRHR